MADLEAIKDALLAGDQVQLLERIQTSLDSGTGAEEILNDGLIKAMDIVGERMKNSQMFIPEVLRCAKVMNAAVEVLKPLLGEKGAARAGKFVIGTVKGDLHDIGKNLFKMMLESSGFEVADLGVDVAPDAFVTAIRESGAPIVGLSALLTTTMPMMKETVDTITGAGLRDQVKIIVGGAPITQKFADEIGADGYGPDAGSGTKLAKQLIS